MISGNPETRQAESGIGRESLDGNNAHQRIGGWKAGFDPGDLDYKCVNRRRRYTRSRFYVLAHEYIKIRSGLLIAVSSNQTVTGWRNDYAVACRDYLAKALEGLHSRRLRVYYCASMLDLAAGSLVWLYTEETVRLRSDNVRARLEEIQDISDAKRLLEHLKNCNEDTRCQQAALADTLDYFSQQEQRLLMEDHLQVARLRSLLWYVGIALVLLVAATPFDAIRMGQAVPGWPIVDLGQVWLTQIVTALAVATLGAVGGIFSGLIKTRDSSTTLDEYRTSMLKLGLRPLVGAVAAITAYLFLGWQITGVKVTNGGTFLLVGFLAGFSERYFLKLLRVPAEDSDKEAQRRDRLTSTRDQLVSIISGGSLPSADVDQPSLFNSEPDGRTVSHGTSKRWLASIIHSR